jgi:UPF0716 protein FxsA
MSDIIGTPLTVLIIIITAIIGSTLIKRSGKEVMAKLQKAMNLEGDLSDAILDGAILIVSGVLLITPGFFTDIFGLLIHIPPLKKLLKNFLRKKFKEKISSQNGFSYYAEFNSDKEDDFKGKTIEVKSNDDFYM